jgi:AcrR family transcriptional regulator
VGRPQVGRKRATTQHDITGVAIELFATRGFDEVSVDDVAAAAGISRRTLFRYYPSKSAIPWGDFELREAAFLALWEIVGEKVEGLVVGVLG